MERMRLQGAAIVTLLLPAACASNPAAVTPQTVSSGIAERARIDPQGWPTRERGALPPGVSLADGLTLEEASAAALWNNPAFQLALTDLGVARADVTEAGLLRNPVLSVLFPWGPKQFEATASWAIDSIWQRPRRLAAARLDVDAIAARLIQDGVVLVGTVRSAYIQAVSAGRRAEIARETANAVARFADIVEARLKGGEISELEARATRDDRLVAEVAARGAEHDRALALTRLKAIVGLPQDTTFTLTLLPELAVQDCGDVTVLVKDALAARPDVRAAEIAVEAAAARAGLARAQAVAVTAMLDANGEGKEGFEMGPGVTVELPVFSRNSGGRARAAAAFTQAQARYLLVRARVDEDVHTAAATLARARDVVGLWEGEALQSVTVAQRQAQLAYEAGELQLLAALDANRRFGTVRLGALDARRDLLMAAAALDQAVGRNCTLK
jgi:cobalt-zinc-cadmium efflux system outer membrane protein